MCTACIEKVTKADLRREMRARLRTLGETRAEKSSAIVATLVAQPIFTTVRRIAVFDPLPVEPDIAALWTNGMERLCFPRLLGETMEFVEIPALEHLTPAAWHAMIREPSASGRVVNPAEIELILVPGVAFTRTGNRMGRGGGYYDRYLAQLPSSTAKYGVCFAVQLEEDLPVEPHDQRLDAIITEDGMLVK